MNNQMPNMPNFAGFTPPNMAGGNFNQSGAERGAEKMRQAVTHSRQIRSTLGHVIHSRAGLVATLKQWNIDLVTSAKELDETGDFVAASYVIYRNHKDFKEPLFAFLQRYPDFAASIKQIEDHAQNVKGRIGLNDVKVPVPQNPQAFIPNTHSYTFNPNYNNYNQSQQVYYEQNNLGAGNHPQNQPNFNQYPNSQYSNQFVPNQGQYQNSYPNHNSNFQQSFNYPHQHAIQVDNTQNNNTVAHQVNAVGTLNNQSAHQQFGSMQTLPPEARYQQSSIINPADQNLYTNTQNSQVYNHTPQVNPVETYNNQINHPHTNSLPNQAQIQNSIINPNNAGRTVI